MNLNKNPPNGGFFMISVSEHIIIPPLATYTNR